MKCKPLSYDNLNQEPFVADCRRSPGTWKTTTSSRKR